MVNAEKIILFPNTARLLKSFVFWKVVHMDINKSATIVVLLKDF
jgi:hypothetical protein